MELDDGQGASVQEEVKHLYEVQELFVFHILVSYISWSLIYCVDPAG